MWNECVAMQLFWERKGGVEMPHASTAKINSDMRWNPEPKHGKATLVVLFVIRVTLLVQSFMASFPTHQHLLALRQGLMRVWFGPLVHDTFIVINPLCLSISIHAPFHGFVVFFTISHTDN